MTNLVLHKELIDKLLKQLEQDKILEEYYMFVKSEKIEKNKIGSEEMPKLNKVKYRTASGEEKVNCYKIIIPKQVVKDANITDQDTLKAIAEKDKIILKKV